MAFGEADMERSLSDEKFLENLAAPIAGRTHRPTQVGREPRSGYLAAAAVRASLPPQMRDNSWCAWGSLLTIPSGRYIATTM